MAETATAASTADIRRGALWSAGSSGLLRVAGMATMIVVVRVVSPEDFGIWAVALTAHSIIVNSAELGVSALLIRRDSDVAALAPSAAAIALLSSGLFALAMFLGAPALAAGLGSDAAAPVMRVMSVSVLLVGVFSVPSALLSREFRQRALFGAKVASLVASNGVLLGLAYGGAGPLAFAWSLVAGQVVGGAVTAARAGRWYWPRLDRRASGLLVRFGAPLAAANAVNYAFLNVDYTVIGHLRGAERLGAYLLAFNVSSWPYAILSASINGVSMPAFSAAGREGLQRRIEVTTQTVAALAFPAAALIAVLSGPLVRALYGDTWGAAAGALAILAPYGALFLITLVLGNALVGMGRSGTLLALQVVWLVTLLPVMIGLVHVAGIRGAAIAHLLVCAGIAWPAYLLLARRTVGIAPRAVLSSVLGPLVLAAVAAAAAGLAAWPFDVAIVQVLVGGTVGTAAYALLASPLLSARLGGRLPIVSDVLDPVARRVHALGHALTADWVFRTPCERRAELDPIGIEVA